MSQTLSTKSLKLHPVIKKARNPTVLLYFAVNKYNYFYSLGHIQNATRLYQVGPTKQLWNFTEDILMFNPNRIYGIKILLPTIGPPSGFFPKNTKDDIYTTVRIY